MRSKGVKTNFPVLVVLSWRSFPGSSVLVVLSFQTCTGRPFLPVLYLLSNILVLVVLAVVSRLCCPSVLL